MKSRTMKNNKIFYILIGSIGINILMYKPILLDMILNIGFHFFGSMLLGYIAPPFTKYKIKDWKKAWSIIYLIMVIATGVIYLLQLFNPSN
jgi:uncharacterized membrane protein AbrB (regulator of aidB expression)